MRGVVEGSTQHNKSSLDVRHANAIVCHCWWHESHLRPWPQIQHHWQPSIPKVLKYFEFNYIFALVLVYTIFFFITYKLYTSFEINNLIKNQDLFTFRWRLFLLGGNILFFCYLVYSNFSTREVYLILLIPQFLFLNVKENKLSSQILFFLIFRYLFLFIYGPSNIDSTYHIDGKRYFNHLFLFTTSVKGLLDFVLMALIGSIVIKINFLILKRFLLRFKY